MFKKILTFTLSLFSLLALSSRPAQAQTFVCPSSDYTPCPILTAFAPPTFTWCCPVDDSGASTCCPGARDLIIGCSDQGVCHPTENSGAVNARCPLNYQNGPVFWCDPNMPDGTPPGETSDAVEACIQGATPGCFPKTGGFIECLPNQTSCDYVCCQSNEVCCLGMTDGGVYNSGVDYVGQAQPVGSCLPAGSLCPGDSSNDNNNGNHSHGCSVIPGSHFGSWGLGGLLALLGLCWVGLRRID